jgi:hypothetical protein
MNLRRAGLAAALAFTSVLPATPVEAASTPAPATTPSSYAVSTVTAVSQGSDASVVATTTASSGAPAVPGGGAAAVAPRGWPFPPIDVSGLVPGLYAVNVHSFQCLTAPATSGPASQRRCVLDGAYRWKLVPASLDARFKLQNAGSSRCLVPSGGLGLALGACGNAIGDTWRLRDAPGTGIYVVNAQSGRCLTVSPGGYAVQYRCDGNIARRWTFRAKPNGKGVVNVNGGTP